MKRIRITLQPKLLAACLCTALLIGLLAGCGASTEESGQAGPGKAQSGETTDPPATGGDSHYPVTIQTYNYGKEPVEVTFDQAPKRVICTNQTQTELMLYFGLEDAIAGCAYLDGPIRDDLKEAYDRLKADGKELTVTGYPDKETVLSLEPDLIFGWRSAFAEDALGDVDEWASLGVGTMILRCSNNTASVCDIYAVLDDIADLGAIFNIEGQTDAYIDKATLMLEDIRAHVQELSEPLKVLILEPMGDNQWYAWTPNTLTGSLVNAAGGDNIAEEDVSTLGIENIVNYGPDAIIVDYMGGQSGDPDEDAQAIEDAIHSLTDQGALAQVPAIANDKIMAVNLTDVYGGGIRMVPSIEAIYNFLYGEE